LAGLAVLDPFCWARLPEGDERKGELMEEGRTKSWNKKIMLKM
jgi:hypothetical protein